MSANIGTNARRKIVAGVFNAALMAFLLIGSAWAQNFSDGRDNVLFTQQDAVQKFDVSFVTGKGSGYQIGTATGKINGSTSVFFDVQLVPGEGGKNKLFFTNHVTITDLDGDQVYFLNEGSGLFHLGDPKFVGTGGPLSGTYKVTGGTGKYASWRVGSTLKYRAIATNPPTNGLGTVYVEVYSNPQR